MNRKSVIVLIFLSLFFSGWAQKATVTSGGVASGSGGTVSFSIGQVAYTTNAGWAGSVAQGVQHPFEIYQVGLKEKAPAISLTVYPNPTPDDLQLKVEGKAPGNMTYQLLDLRSHLLTEKKITGNPEIISMKSLPVATYFLRITEGSVEKAMFKIIKN